MNCWAPCCVLDNFNTDEPLKKAASKNLNFWPRIHANKLSKNEKQVHFLILYASDNINRLERKEQEKSHISEQNKHTTSRETLESRMVKVR